MFDCANVEMRELLPELASGALDAATRARVEAHLAGCAECAAELETLRLVRAEFSRAPRIDTRRIVAALPRPAAPAAPPATRAHARVPAGRWMDWRVAAAVTMITVGGLSVAVTDRMRVGTDVDTPSGRIDSTTAAASPTTRPSDTGRATDSGRGPGFAAAGVAPATRAQLSFGGGVGDLDTQTIEALMSALDEIDRAPVAPSAEPDRTPVLPAIGDGTS
jgi:hypothetical protein